MSTAVKHAGTHRHDSQEELIAHVVARSIGRWSMASRNCSAPHHSSPAHWAGRLGWAGPLLALIG
jgi:hypothetical protein